MSRHPLELKAQGARDREIKGPDGTRLHLRDWPQVQGSLKGHVFIVHGMGEHIGRYEHLAAYLNEQGYAAWGLDLRGWGLSGGVKGHVDGMQQWVDDVAALIASVPDDGKPRFLYGHSMGGLVVMSVLRLAGDLGLRGVIVSNPPLKATVEVPKWKELAGKGLASLIPTLRMPTGLAVEGICRDPRIVAHYQADPRNFDKISTRGYTSLLEAIEAANAHPEVFRLPSLWILGLADPICHAPTTRDWVAKLTTPATVLAFEGWYHECHNEPEWEQVAQGLTTWLDRHLS